MTDETIPSLCEKEGCQFYGSVLNAGYCSGCVPEKITSSPSNSRALGSQLPTRTVRPTTARKRRSRSKSVEQTQDSKQPELSSPSTSAAPHPAEQESGKKRKVNRCGVCSKNVGLLGFDCRCGGLFCSLHRGDNNHDCQFDYKTLQRAELVEKNPKIVSDKVTKI